MDEEPELGFRQTAAAPRHGPPGATGPDPGRPHRTRDLDHAGEPTLDDLRETLVAVYGTDFGLRSATLDLPLHRRGAPGRHLPPGPRAARRRRRSHPPPAGGPGHGHGRAGRGEPRVEAGPGGPRDVPGPSAGHVPRRAAPGRGPRAAHHHGPGRRSSARRAAPGRARHDGRLLAHGRATPAHHRDAGRPRHPLRPRRRAPADRPPHARPRPRTLPTGPPASSPCSTPPGPCSWTLAAGEFDLGSWADRVRRSTPPRTGSASSRWSARSRRPRRCSSDPTATSPGRERSDPALPRALETWFGP